MTDTAPKPLDVVQEALQGVAGYITKLFTQYQHDLVLLLRQPSPQKIKKTLVADGSGNIGGGWGSANAVELYMAPVSHEAWVNRISILAAGTTAANPLTTGAVLCTGSSGGIIFSLPAGGAIAPVIITEGRLSAPHLSAGERLDFTATGLHAGTVLTID